MFVRLSNTPRDYPWGSRTAISDLLGTQPSGGPEAELWLGAHPGSPARILDPHTVGGAANVREWITADPETALGTHTQLPFLLKVLAADGPLSLQAHPTLERAIEGFARENAAGIPLDAPNRNYKDPLHKPEVIYALSDRFEALCGFRPVAEIRTIFAVVQAWDAASATPAPALFEPVTKLFEAGATDNLLRSLVAWLLSGGEEVAALVNHVVDLVASRDTAAIRAETEAAPFAASFETVRDLAAAYPGDPGIVTSLLLNRVSLKAGEALYLPAGNIHAYLQGLGVELMAASDNVLRGGLTPKYIDVPELLSVLTFESLPVPYIWPRYPSKGVEEFRPDVSDFVLLRIKTDVNERASYRAAGAAIALCVSGSLELHGEASGQAINRGEAVFITPDEGAITLTGEGVVFIAAPGSSA
jgi:mannose-6-phosphate isomerase